MSEKKIVLQVEVVSDNQMKVTWGNRHPALMALALQNADLSFKEMLMDLTQPEQSPIMQIPQGLTVPTGLIQ